MLHSLKVIKHVHSPGFKEELVISISSLNNSSLDCRLSQGMTLASKQKRYLVPTPLPGHIRVIGTVL